MSLPGSTCSRLVPSSSSSASRSALLDAEMPTTATMAAMPIVMPTAVSNVRRRLARSPTRPCDRMRRPEPRGCKQRGAEWRAHGVPPCRHRGAVAVDAAVAQARPGSRAADHGVVVMRTTVVPVAWSAPNIEDSRGVESRCRRSSASTIAAPRWPGEATRAVATQARPAVARPRGQPDTGQRPSRRSRRGGRNRGRRDGRHVVAADSPGSRWNRWNTKPSQGRSSESGGRQPARSDPPQQMTARAVERPDMWSSVALPTPKGPRWPHLAADDVEDDSRALDGAAQRGYSLTRAQMEQRNRTTGSGPEAGLGVGRGREAYEACCRPLVAFAKSPVTDKPSAKARYDRHQLSALGAGTDRRRRRRPARARTVDGRPGRPARRW